MGFYLNSTEPLEMYREIVNSPYFVDKSAILTELNSLIGTETKYVCITRPRRFGKSVVASMIASYYSFSCDAVSIFDHADISCEDDYKMHAVRCCL